jgi:glycosyltransferase involved in cell wall biosynthesis
MINPCIIIPVYNHHQSMALVTSALKKFNIPCFIINDGSHQQCRQVLQDIADKENWIKLHHFEQNQGKGAAVCFGLKQAFEQGFSHALQIDADGQHDINDISKFIQTAETFPEAIVTGARVADGISAARHYGRMLTDGLVWLQTLSFQIKDSMCGYRVYPLASTMELLKQHRVGQRMDFDTDIIVRLFWRNIAIKQVQTRVIYRQGIPSHFDMLNDNLRITRMHTRLVLGMLIRLPTLITRKLSNKRIQQPTN